MKALTVCQPYAHVIAIGEKVIENRPWHTSYRGPLAIHAGKSDTWLTPGDQEQYPDMVFGGVVAVCTLFDCVSRATLTRRILNAPIIDKTWVPYAGHKDSEGPVCWLLKDVVALEEPIVVGGRQGVWELPAEISRRLPPIVL